MTGFFAKFLILITLKNMFFSMFLAILAVFWDKDNIFFKKCLQVKKKSYLCTPEFIPLHRFINNIRKAYCKHVSSFLVGVKLVGICRESARVSLFVFLFVPKRSLTYWLTR
jgi:hypothetical protein